MKAFLPALSLGSLLYTSCADKITAPPLPTPPEVDDHGHGIGCSWYCGAPPISINASTTLRDGIHSYDVSNIHDYKKDTVWVEGAEGYGIGESVTFHFDTRAKQYEERENPLGINRLSLINGFARTSTHWSQNSRVKTLKILVNGKYLSTVNLKDTVEPQSVEFPDITFKPGTITQVSFVITDVYPGTHFQDTAIADIFFSGFGVH
ncbi:hypothetical protein SAMN02745181_2858 [Rubritalea squalenifaciens DSM 18772]|uniref:NAD glycohydrolase translocation F5/8 type C domain-containing protein n=1 Tax=Rubritalea squalenifaciens DSM 18772 TaxID=1123071 RepID=A0A1M6NHQ0_9BACT|nr:hypothetical protein [Rubritalea squalenifaciens]SHJ95144.1 hypothetical protein SAMN02745181_2858 [Rubritalea squalenifaciens DSM 18772]